MGASRGLLCGACGASCGTPSQQVRYLEFTHERVDQTKCTPIPSQLESPILPLVRILVLPTGVQHSRSTTARSSPSSSAIASRAQHVCAHSNASCSLPTPWL
jgi:hypothetical protein